MTTKGGGKKKKKQGFTSTSQLTKITVDTNGETDPEDSFSLLNRLFTHFKQTPPLFEITRTLNHVKKIHSDNVVLFITLP